MASSMLLLIVLLSSSFLFVPSLGASYHGRLASTKYDVGDPEQVSVALGPTNKSCSISWVSQLEPNFDEREYYPSFNPRDGDNASVYFAETFYTFAMPMQDIPKPAEYEREREGEGGQWESKIGYATVYTESRCGTSRLMHSVMVEDCHPGDPMWFKVRSLEQRNTTSDGTKAELVPVTPFSKVFKFTLPDPSNERGGPINIGLTADLDATHVNPEGSIPALSKAALNGDLDLLIHGGDIAYDLDDDCGNVGDDFFRKTQNISTVVPYIWGVGDHEGMRKDIADDCHAQGGFDYEGYRMRMGEASWGGQLGMAHASGSPSTFYFAFKTRWVQFIVINTNAYVHACLYWLLQPQYDFVLNTLKSVDRNKTPWVVVIGHRSMYCVKSNDTECNQESESMRYGVPKECYDDFINIGSYSGKIKDNNNLFGLEKLLKMFEVDLYFSGHTHHYERSFPVYDEKPEVYADIHKISNPANTIFVVGGITGVSPDVFSLPPKPFTAFRDPTYSEAWGTLKITNATHARYEQRFASNSTLLDWFDVTKPPSGQKNKQPVATCISRDASVSDIFCMANCLSKADWAFCPKEYCLCR